jgi:drug/metabolite transporter (DMT)-like permease
VATTSAVCYGFAVIFIHYAYQAGVLPATAAFLRYAIASAMMILLLTLTRYSVKLPLRRAMLLLGMG